MGFPLQAASGTSRSAAHPLRARIIGYFETLGVKPWRGRFFTPDESRIGAVQAVAVLGHSLWRRRYGADGDAALRVGGRELR